MREGLDSWRMYVLKYKEMIMKVLRGPSCGQQWSLRELCWSALRQVIHPFYPLWQHADLCHRCRRTWSKLLRSLGVECRR